MTIQEFIGHLFEIEVTGHIAHLQTRSYAEHVALNELYTGIVDHRDSYAETYQGLNGIIARYPSSIKVVEGGDIVLYLKNKVSAFREMRKEVKETELQQKVDDVIEFLDVIIYKLKYLS